MRGKDSYSFCTKNEDSNKQCDTYVGVLVCFDLVGRLDSSTKYKILKTKL